MEMANAMLTALKKRFREDENFNAVKTNNNNNNMDAVLRALELLRINIQSAFDKEIDNIVKKYFKIYFQPAFENIKTNLKNYSESEEMLDIMKCSLIENSKYQYNYKASSGQQQPRSIFFLTTTQSTSNNQSNAQKQIVIAPKPEIVTQVNSNNTNVVSKTGILKRSFIDNISSSSDSAIPIKRSIMVPKTGVQSTGTEVIQNIPTQRRQIYWHTANISTDTNFVLDVNANQAFGFNSDGRERLASKHPELIRYLPDSQDREWLVQNNITTKENRSLRLLLLVYDEVIKLGNSDLYKFQENLNLQILQPFTLPHFTVQKMKTFFIDLNIKSRGLITNSFSSNIVNVHKSIGSGDVSEAFVLQSSNLKLDNNSQLRNALLQTSQRSNIGKDGTSIVNKNSTDFQNHLLVAVSTSISSTANEVNESNLKHQTNLPQTKLSNQVVTSVLKAKGKSVLSSSHATLTALLTNNNSFCKINSNRNYKNNESFEPNQTQF